MPEFYLLRLLLPISGKFYSEQLHYPYLQEVVDHLHIRAAY